tara:strand:+ start:448 stop:672 length:225 start_codon:yes stop_codon:yes gene_type:complete
MERVTPLSKYNYYKYYNARKEHYKMNYLEKKRRDAIEEQNKKFYKDYWTLSLWKEENMREYKKNKIIINNNNET